MRQRLDGTTPPEVLATPFVHHDFLEGDDGGWRWLSHVFDQVALDGSLLVAPVATDTLVHRPAAGDDTVVFDFFEDFPVRPWWVCDHMSAGRFVAQHFEWTHGNSLLERPDGDGWWVMARYLDALVHIGADGSFRSQLGGRDSTWTLPAEAQFVHAHASHAFDDRVLVFDNGDSHDPDAPLPISRLLELQLDASTQTASVAWSLDHPDGDYTAILGDAQRLPGGNTLASWGGQGRVTEVDDGGTILWDLAIPDAVVARVVFVTELVGAGR